VLKFQYVIHDHITVNNLINSAGKGPVATLIGVFGNKNLPCAQLPVSVSCSSIAPVDLDPLNEVPLSLGTPVEE